MSADQGSAATADRPGEFELIARHFAPLALDQGTFGLTDDAASLTPPPGCDLVLTNDALVADVHFFRHDPALAIAQKALRVNLSDLAAKGARPLGYMLGLGLPKDWTAAWMAEFAAGLAADQMTYGIGLIGGDTVSSPDRLVLSITAIGTVPTGKRVRRGGAKPGDVLVATGTIGDAALGLQLRLHFDLAGKLGLSTADQNHLLERYLLPRPRVAAADAVLAHAHGGMDISDGLLGDIAKMAQASRVAIAVNADLVPLSAAAKAMISADASYLDTALTGGDD